MKSTEYPDLTFVKPKAFNTGRPDGPPLWIVVHTTEGSEGLRSAEDGAAYDKRRTDGTSTHYFHDQDTTVQCVLTKDRANAAKGTGNRRGIHHELCGRAAQNPTQWHDAASTGTLERFARQAARDAKRWNIPVRHLTVAQVRNFDRGFCSHSDITAAFGESDHTDPGRNYPWTETLNRVRAIMAPPKPQEDEVSAADVTSALEQPRPYKLARIKERGWSDTSLVVKVEYIFEAMVAAGMIAADPDGVVDDSASVQARLARIEAALGRLEHAVPPGAPGA
jgi:hypothetical protein